MRLLRSARVNSDQALALAIWSGSLPAPKDHHRLLRKSMSPAVSRKMLSSWTSMARPPNSVKMLLW